MVVVRGQGSGGNGWQRRQLKDNRERFSQHLLAGGFNVGAEVATKPVQEKLAGGDDGQRTLPRLQQSIGAEPQIEPFPADPLFNGSSQSQHDLRIARRHVLCPQRILRPLTKLLPCEQSFASHNYEAAESQRRQTANHGPRRWNGICHPVTCVTQEARLYAC